MWIKDDEPKPEPHMMTKEKARDMTMLERKREQSRASTRRWRANEQTILETLRHQVVQLEAELKSKLSVVGTESPAVAPASSAPARHGHRMDQLLAKKRFFIAQNMQLQEAIKMHVDKLNHVASLIQRHVQATLYDDAFLLYVTRQTQIKLGAMDLRSQFRGAERDMNGISCVALTRGQSLDYDMQKRHHGISHVLMGDLAWAMYQDRATFLPLVDRVLDHRVIRRVNDNMLVIETKAWTLSNPNQIERRYLVVQRDVSATQYKVTVTTLTESLSPAPHAFCFDATDITPWAFTGRLVGTCCLKTASPEDARATVESMVFSQCRFESFVRARVLTL